MLIKFTKQMKEKLKDVKEKEQEYKAERLTSPEEVWRKLNAFEACIDELEREKERFYSIGLDNNLKIKYIDIVSTGTINANMAYPREVFRTAVLSGVASILIAHNHPAGTLEPSSEDKAITIKLVKAGEILNIKVLDHIIVTKAGFMSFKERGLI